MPVEIVRRPECGKFSVRRLKTWAVAILRLLGHQRSELSIALVGNREMRKLNAKFRRRDYPTDVLSFPADETLPGPTRLLGDVAISIEKARQQAAERGRGLEEEMATLLIHGVLHLLGYDHERSSREARRMATLEKKIYRALCGGGRLPV